MSRYLQHVRSLNALEPDVPLPERPLTNREEAIISSVNAVCIAYNYFFVVLLYEKRKTKKFELKQRREKYLQHIEDYETSKAAVEAMERLSA